MLEFEDAIIMIFFIVITLSVVFAVLGILTLTAFNRASDIHRREDRSTLS